MKMKGVQILNFMGSSNQRLLIHQDMDEINIKDSIDIVLTPQFYTLLQEDLEVKFAYQAKNIAPAFFDDYLSNHLEYQYHVYKHANKWYFFAYSVDEITSFLEEKGLSSHQIDKIYFAQELEESLVDPVLVGDKMAMQTLDSIVTLLPQRLVNANVEYKLLNLKQEKFQNGVTLSSAYDSIIPFKETVLLSTLLFVLGTFFFFEGNRERSSIENLQLSKDELLEKYPKLASSLQRNSQMKKYEKIDKIERKKRKTLMQISKIISSKNRLKTLSMNDGSIMVIVLVDSKERMNKVKQMAKKKNFKLSNESDKEISMEKQL